ncbi:hypothetical protein GCM10023189_39020 [Nibrella saemangeumensis]|uniref:DarT domain-containing protein n=1 Tax=Nibrella saemangeumensis TaxID=1084526 RepID=A0ABP8N723_9BACT
MELICLVDHKLTVSEYVYPVIFKTTHLAEKEDIILCEVVQKKGGHIKKAELALLLGLSIEDTPQKKIYADPGEQKIFSFFVDKLQKYHLLEEKEIKVLESKEEFLFITDLGEGAIESGNKHLFSKEGIFKGYKFDDLSADGSFPFYKYFELNNNTNSGKNCSPREYLEIKIKAKPFQFYTEVFQNEVNAKENGIEVTCIGKGNFHYRFDVVLSCKVELSSTGDYYVTAIHDEKEDSYLTHLLNVIYNEAIKLEVIREAQFQSLWGNPTSVFDSNNISEFKDKWNWSALVIDKRIQWDDPYIFEQFIQQDVEIWSTVSEVAPINFIQEHLFEYVSYWNWTSISGRLQSDFILENIIKEECHWDFEELSTRGSEFIRDGVLLTYSNKIYPRWAIHLCQSELSDNFIYETFNQFSNYNYQELQSRGESLVVKILNKSAETGYRPPFDYNALTNSLSLDNIKESLSSLGKYLNWSILIQRVSVEDPDWLTNPSFLEHLNGNANRTNSFTTEKLEWDEVLIDLMDELGLLRWKSYGADKGFECNEHIKWSLPLFSRYKEKISSKQGHAHVSASINSVEFIRQNPEFSWDWVQIALNKHFQIDENILDEFTNIVDWSALSTELPELFIVTRLERFKENWDWDVLSKRISADIISYSLRAFPWNYLILSNRETSFLDKVLQFDNALFQAWNWSSLANKLSIEVLYRLLDAIFTKLDNSSNEITTFWEHLTERLPAIYILEHAQYPWNWHYLTRNINKEAITAYLVQRRDKWDWVFLTSVIYAIEEIKNLSLTYKDITSYWDWPFIIDKLYTTEAIEADFYFICDSLYLLKGTDKYSTSWSIITRKVNTEFLYGRLMPNDDGDYIALDWGYISTSGRLPWENRSFIERYLEKWNWLELSKNNKVNARLEYLRLYRKRWDWTYISEKSWFLRNEIKDKNGKEFGEEEFSEVRDRNLSVLRQFKDEIDFGALSKRRDIRFDDKLLAKSSRWDYQILSKSINLFISSEFLINNRDIDWDWQALSSYSNITPLYDEKGEGLLSNDELIKKPWDWYTIGSRKDVVFSFDLVKRTSDKPWDYYNLTPKLFLDSTKVRQLLGLLKDKPLNWQYISKNIDFAKADEDQSEKRQSLLSLYKEQWDWNELSLSASLKSKFVDITFIQQFEEKWNYRLLSKNPEVYENSDVIAKLKHKPWDWKFLSGKIKATDVLLEELKDVLDWSTLSESSLLQITEDALIRYRRYWNWNSLYKKSIEREEKFFYNTINKLLDQDCRLLFLKRLSEQNSPWKGNIYHYAHLENAASILNQGKIKSRRLAAFKDTAAQQIVWRRTDPHSYARFYFRPKTPYQFYTERLGRKFGSPFQVEYPKCPVPVFFQLNLSEVLFDEEIQDSYFISNNNFHADWTTISSLDKAVHTFSYSGVYRRYQRDIPDISEYKRQVQQEFVISDELDITKYESLLIICETSNDARSLLSSLDNPRKWMDKIKVSEGDCFMDLNSYVDVQQYSDIIIAKAVQNEYAPVIGKIKFASDDENFECISSGRIYRETAKSITADGYLELKLSTPETQFTIQWIDESEVAWNVYKSNAQEQVVFI